MRQCRRATVATSGEWQCKTGGVRQWRRATAATPGEWQCKTGGVRRLAVANGPNIFQMLLVDIVKVDEDEPLFLSLISDLFPGIQLDVAVYADLQKAISSQVATARLINHPSWNLKVIQVGDNDRVYVLHILLVFFIVFYCTY